MTLVIDIPDETVNAIKDNVMFGVIPSEILWDVTSAIVNGTPLDKIRTEIKEIAKDYDKFADYRRVYGLWIALDIIDKYMAETEQVGNPDRLEEKDKQAINMQYIGFNQHNCEAIYKCPVCGKEYYGWNLWITEKNKGILECKCHTLLNIPK